MLVESLSPSRASDFMRCPLLYRYRAIDRFEEPAAPAAMRGTLVHSVLEALFDLPSGQRTPEAAQALVPGAYQRLRQRDHRVDQLFADGSLTEEAFIGGARELVDAYFALEDPRRLQPEARELLIEARWDGGPPLRGYVDRLDVAAADGAIRVVDYKTGKAPAPRFQSEMLFQLRFYSLIIRLARGRQPDTVRLVYLGDRQILDAQPTPSDLDRTKLRIETIWSEITRMLQTQDFPPVKGPLCGWCAFQDKCPLFGGEVPTFPSDGRELPAATPR
ncbi:MAG: PD-(D/E)XK nuclease family protein [Bifidobacteriaceae bacterium]|jgi:putative RecB family exonuclease|nr:PD-(D/E)XK nuclease family protein [Bifidobacteriaceae bacterium]